MSRIYIVGDIHGHYDDLLRLLRAEQIIDEHLCWAAGDATLWFLGDFFDRGPDGVNAVALAMRLQQEAAAAGGRVSAVIGNHDVLLLSVLRFGRLTTQIITAVRHGIVPLIEELDWLTAIWIRNGGVPNDLAYITPEQVAWLAALPAMALEDDRLLIHADSTLYLHYGLSIEAVNDAFAELLHGHEREAWDLLLDRFSEHKGFLGGASKARRFLGVFGGRQIIHGHTPIMKASGEPAATADTPLLYANGLCLNVDHGLYQGGPGFIYRLA